MVFISYNCWKDRGFVKDKRIVFLYPSEKDLRFFECNHDGIGRQQLSNIDGDVNC